MNGRTGVSVPRCAEAAVDEDANGNVCQWGSHCASGRRGECAIRMHVQSAQISSSTMANSSNKKRENSLLKWALSNCSLLWKGCCIGLFLRQKYDDYLHFPLNNVRFLPPKQLLHPFASFINARWPIAWRMWPIGHQ